MYMKKIICVVGTRPEAIKMAPVIQRLLKESWADVKVLATAQHRQMLDQVLKLFKITPDRDLNVMAPNQTLVSLTAKLLTELDIVFKEERPDAVLAQGDTTTVMAVALCCFYNRIPFGHVEAGLRTGDIWNPYPEEMNRVVAGHLAKWHFAPTDGASQNLVRQGISPESIYMTGNTVIDALLSVSKKEGALDVPINDNKRLILVTSHRRENFGKPFEEICRALLHLVKNNQDVEILYPVHPNPNVREVAYKLLGDNSRIHLCEPLDYLPFVNAMKRAYLILSDSGGVQEEAPALAKPVLVLRRETERPEAVDYGVVKLVGTDFEDIVSEAQRLLDDPEYYSQMAKGVSPYGDGFASERITQVLKQALSGS
ncbi:non-hydrolyzing UDP-N-acetylglucosamine 2-epimerase [Undibacterium terreum]|uniref:UDP-N-acetylglucosamine 2-epimerase (non-hydrolyzing) n=1 Tax=Undibacterium terreum TaxID=1224302 RepID=A0A916UTA3_9BURK|nr:UDP-N-acetylglucosamine 2-epimerase (non-hydrolyzing) [Undibacterium terreum]GGC87386.1 UDP-N-acetylglucosamine 2-epimerase [Undibacterium terreum]